MQTRILDRHARTAEGREADTILRACVHCGFCTATCPTYQLLGDELDSPRGRIYLIKQLLEGASVTARTQVHLDRCLTCRACETTCPSGVRYGRLVEIGRSLVEDEVPRPLPQRWQRALLRHVVPYPERFRPLLRLGNWLRPLLPARLTSGMPRPGATQPHSQAGHPRRMLLLAGCVQSVATPGTNVATARVFGRLGISLAEAPDAGCCGAVSHHLSAADEALGFMRRNIDAWWPEIEAGAEALVITASGCGAVVKEYGDLLRHDPAYADKAARVSALTRDVAEVLRDEDLAALGIDGGGRRIAVHSPCTLQHGQKLPGVVEALLERLGYTLTPVADAHLCCGSAGTYSILHPELSRQLRDNKLAALEADDPELIVTANIGCQLHLGDAAARPVMHWIELLDEAATG